MEPASTYRAKGWDHAKCPKCGYDEGVAWPALLSVLSFTFLYFLFIVTTDHASKLWELLGMIAFLISIVTSVWKERRDKLAGDEYQKLHPSITERVKSHIKVGDP